jgi:hypothetical protein
MGVGGWLRGPGLDQYGAPTSWTIRSTWICCRGSRATTSYRRLRSRRSATIARRDRCTGRPLTPPPPSRASASPARRGRGSRAASSPRSRVRGWARNLAGPDGFDTGAFGGLKSLILLAARTRFAPLEGWRHVKVTDRRAAVDYAHALLLALPSVSTALSGTSSIIASRNGSRFPLGFPLPPFLSFA